MKKRKITVTLLLLFVLNVCTFFVHGQLKIELISDSPLTEEGLYFEGEKNINYRFGKRITPHGDCIDVINGYVYVTWYKGGMDKRNLMVSRKKIEGGEWKTIEFPDQHIGYRGDPKIGDSHNTAAIAVCPIDSTVHLIYDMHAYSKADFPDHYFNYRITQKGSAFVPDDEWTIQLFNPKQNHLNPAYNYEKFTYPGFIRFDDGRIMVEFRLGGSGNGNDNLAIYDGKNWSANMQYNNGNQPDHVEKYSIYGSYQYLHGKLIAGYSIRYRIANEDEHPLYDLNNGLFYSEAKSPYGQNDWTDIDGRSISLPVQNPNSLKVAEPCEIGIGNRITMGPIWTVTKNGAIHFLTAVSGNDVHFYKAPGSSAFSYSQDCPKANGSFFCFDDKVLNVALENGRVIIRTTKEGQNNWQIIYKQTSGDTYRHCNVRLDGDRLFVYAMKNGSGDSQPITLLTFSVTELGAVKVKQLNEKKVKIYPNPASDKIFVKGLYRNSEIEIFNQQGQKCYELKLQNSADTVQLDLSRLRAGLFLLKIGDQRIRFTKI